MKDAMKAKDQNALTSLRAIKSAILLAQTESGAKQELTEAQELKILQKLVKQRKDSARIFEEQGRVDLAEPELAQAQVIATFLPEQMDNDAIAAIVNKVIAATGAAGMKDMGKVIGLVNAQVAGKADGAKVAGLVKAALTT
jgi:uncharacterized protein YqeY